uniref:RBR-type E3 ubiquitin transferase n=1 Tax=Parascaris univalens TaxID=6257 RepID=A0A915B3U5_PARUN
MPEHFDSEIPVVRRKSKDLRIHRVVRRDIWPDYISKQMVSSETFCGAYAYLDDSNTIDPSKWMDTDHLARAGLARFPAIELADPFGMRTFHMKYSLNKKYRWELDEELSENIHNYQNESVRLKTSYLRTITRDTGWLHENGCYWQKRNKVCGVESATVRDGQVIHRYANKANKYDLLNKPRKPRNGKTRWSRDEVIYKPENDGWSGDLELHVLYKTTTNRWDRRIRNKCDRKIALKNRESQKKFIKKHHDAKTVWPDEVYDEFEVYSMDEDCVEYLPSSPAETYELPAVTCAVTKRSQRRKRHRSNKRRAPDYADAYKEWLYSAPEEPPRTTNVSCSASEHVAIYEAVTKDNEEVVSHITEPRFLTSVIVPIPERLTLRDYVLGRFPTANRIERLQPETFLVAVSDEFFVEVQNSTLFSGFVSIRMENSEIEVNHPIVRWTFNKISKVLNGESKHNMPSSSGSAVLCGSTVNVLPPSLISDADCFNEGAVRKELVNEWLTTANMQSAVKESVHSNTSSVCEVCLGDDQQGFSLHCGHHFCATCWVLNAQQCLSTGIVPIQCMSNGCCAALELDQALTVIPHEDCMRYEQMLWNKMVLREGWMYCDDCGCVICPKQSTSKSQSVALCGCGAAKCIKCKGIFHAPMPCHFAEQYCDILHCNGTHLFTH